jgi:hypothetical protein
VTFTPTDTTDYLTVVGSANVTVNKAAPSSITWPTASSITYGQSLASSTLSGGASTPAGTFAFTTPGTAPPIGTNSQSVTFTPTDTTDYNSVVGSANVTVTKATASLVLGNLSHTYTGSPLAATATTNPTGLTVNFTYNGSSTAPTAAGSYTVVGTISDTDYSGSATGTLIISQASSAVNLTSSVNPVLTTNPTTLTATVSATQGTPTGSVSFLDGSTLIGQGTLASGVATLTISSLAVGSHSITAIYSGDTNFVASTSGALAESVLDFALSIPTSGSGSGASQTVASGGTATYTLDIAPTTGTSIPTAAALTLTGLPTGATATVTPSTWTQLTGSSWSLPANTVLAPVVLSIQLPSQTARLEHNDLYKGKLPYALLGLLLLPFAGRLRRTGKRLSGALSILILLVAGVTAMAGLSGCGSTGSKSSSQPQSYTITETITSGALSHSTTITLDVN